MYVMSVVGSRMVWEEWVGGGLKMKMRVGGQRSESEGARDAHSTTSSDEAPSCGSGGLGSASEVTGGTCLYCQSESGNLIQLRTGSG